MSFKKAVKKQLKAKILLSSLSGGGKTYSALRMARGIVGPKGRIGVIDSENKSSNLYANIFNFDVADISAPFHPKKYVDITEEAIKSFDILIIDSITHEWSGEGGCLEIKENIGQRYQDWKPVTKLHNKFINSIIQAPIHIITTVRTKIGYEINKEDGKTKVTKLGLQPITREGFEYENTIVFSINENNIATATKNRSPLFKGENFQITEQTGEQIAEWLNDGVNIIDKITEECKNNATSAEWKKSQEELRTGGYLSTIEGVDCFKELYAEWEELQESKE